MKLSKTLLAFALTTALIPTTIWANTDAASQLIMKVANGQVKIVKQFPSTGNLEGFVVEPVKGPKQQTVIYADKEGKYMIAGTVIDANGNNLTQSDFNQQIASAQSPGIFNAALHSNWVEDGKANAPHKMYVMIEPNCIACHMLYQELQPMINSGQLAVRWILVSFMKPQSDGMSAAIMLAKDPGAAMAQNEHDFDTKTETGGIKPVAVTESIKQKLKQNMDFMTKAGFAGTPAIIYKTTDGKYQVVRGYMGGAELQKAVSSMANQFN